MTVPTGPNIVVVGGGVAGLVVAHEVAVARPDAHVTVLEAGEDVGGKLRRAEVAGHRVDVGAESVLARRPEAIDLFRELEVEHAVVHPAPLGASIWSRGALHPVPPATLMGIPGEPEQAKGILTDEEVRRAVAEPDDASPLVADTSVAEYVAARVGPAVVDRLVEPLLGGVYAGRPHRLSLRATLPQAWGIAASGERLLDGVRRITAPMRAPRSAGSTRSPAPVFAGLRGGVGILPERLVADLRTRGADVRTRAVVRELRRRPGGWDVVSGPTRDPEVHAADAVVLATPARPTGRLLAPHAARAAQLLGSVEYASMAIVTVAFDPGDMADLPGSGFLVPATDRRVIKASTFSSRKWPWLVEEAPDAEYLRASVGRAGEEEDLQRGDRELVAMALAELTEAVGRHLGHPIDTHVQRWGGALPQYEVGHIDLVEKVMSAVAGLPGIEVAGAAYDGVGIPAVIAGAQKAAAAVVTHLHPTRG